MVFALTSTWVIDGAFWPPRPQERPAAVQSGRGLDRPRIAAALQSRPTWSRPAAPELVAETLVLFGYHDADLDPCIPPALAHAAEHARQFHTRNPFASGGVYEDMGMRSLLHAETGALPGGSIRVSGVARPLTED